MSRLLDAVTLTVDEAAGQSLGRGMIGTALLHAERAWNGTGAWAMAQQSIRSVTAGPVDAAEHARLYYGAPAVAFLLHSVADRHPRYRAAGRTLDRHVLHLARRRLIGATERPQSITFAEFDLFRGLTGIGALLLRLHPGCEELADILRYLSALAVSSHCEDDLELPGWWVDHDPDVSVPTPGGHANLGMAHGAAGLLAMLSLAALRGLMVEGQLEAISKLTQWFDRWRQEDSEVPWWPQWLTRDEIRSGQTSQAQPGRPSWCYGAVGIARAQQLAALATDDTQRQELAELAMAANLADAQLDRLTDSSLCHGAAGVYQTAFRAARDARNLAIAERLPAVISRFTSGLVFHEGAPIGLLTGSAGIGLARETARTNAPPITGWDACLLIT
ncbi:lanthionine synthetase [Pseudonocardiaceae bacterium YIM PH 21723]|nr:lanthionine synthetase [Pseudonocardiaceae bacterium YIM PH 21723]